MLSASEQSTSTTSAINNSKTGEGTRTTPMSSKLERSASVETSVVDISETTETITVIRKISIPSVSENLAYRTRKEEVTTMIRATTSMSSASFSEFPSRYLLQIHNKAPFFSTVGQDRIIFKIV